MSEIVNGQRYQAGFESEGIKSDFTSACPAGAVPIVDTHTVFAFGEVIAVAPDHRKADMIVAALERCHQGDHGIITETMVEIAAREIICCGPSWCNDPDELITVNRGPAAGPWVKDTFPRWHQARATARLVLKAIAPAWCAPKRAITAND